MNNIKLEIYTPDGTLINDEVYSVTLPGTKGPFTVLNNHGPIISSLKEGIIKYAISIEDSGIRDNKFELYKIEVKGGFVEVNNNIVTVSLEKTIK